MEKLSIQNMSANELSSYTYFGEIVQGNLMTREEMGKGLKYILELFQREMEESRQLQISVTD